MSSSIRNIEKNYRSLNQAESRGIVVKKGGAYFSVSRPSRESYVSKFRNRRGRTAFSSGMKKTTIAKMPQEYVSAQSKALIKLNRMFKEKVKKLSSADRGSLIFHTPKLFHSLTLFSNLVTEIQSSKFSLEFTSDDSLLFSVKKDLFTFYIEDDYKKKQNRFVLNGFKEHDSLPNFEGNFTDIMVEVLGVVNN